MSMRANAAVAAAGAGGASKVHQPHDLSGGPQRSKAGARGVLYAIQVFYLRQRPYAHVQPRAQVQAVCLWLSGTCVSYSSGVPVVVFAFYFTFGII